MNHSQRLTALRDGRHNPLLVTTLVNIRYLTGFTGSSAYLAVWPDRAVFVTDGRYAEPAAELVAGLDATELVVNRGAIGDVMRDLFLDDDLVDVEAEAVTLAFAETLTEATGSDLRPRTGLVAELRTFKDEDEIAALERAAAAGDAAFSRLDDLIRDAAHEAELGWELVAAMREEGADAAGWEPIVASGPGASVPHYRSGRNPVGDGILLLDYGCVVDGYHSDMSRTVWLGSSEPDAETLRMYEAVLAAQEAAIEAVRPGVPAKDVDAAARSVLADHGLAEFFVHSTGHGVGLEIHEDPRVATTSGDVLEPGNVITVEPGVYRPGRGGVRIEDMVLVTDSGHRVLTQSPKEFIR